MPLFAINLPDAVFDPIKELIDQRRYRDVEGFVEVAALNQLALERGTPPADLAPVKSRSEREGPKRHNESAGLAARSIEPHRNGRQDARSRKPADGRIARTTFVLEKKSSSDISPQVLEPFARHDGTEVLVPASPNGGAADHVFGQVNRLFPLKVACRGIVNVALANGKHWPEYSVVHDVVGEHASKLGSMLEKWDQQHDR
jgi:hypothetical protein